MSHSPKLVASLLALKAKLEAMPEQLRGPFRVAGLRPYRAALESKEPGNG